MFSIEPSPTIGVSGDEKWVIDRDRGAWLQRVGRYAMAHVTSFQLHVDDRVFLVESEREQEPDGRYSSRIVNLGFSAIGKMLSGTRSDRFKSAEDRLWIGLLAAEALLVYGGNYDGSTDPTTNDQTIELDGLTFRLSDFVTATTRS